MLHKGHARSLGIPLLVALAVCAGLTFAVDATSAPFAPIGGASTAHYDALGRVSHHQYIGEFLPPRPGRVGTAQGSGPVPDTDLTPTAEVSQERDPNGSPSVLTNRVVFSSNGVDEDADARIDPTFPEDPTFVADYNIWIMRPDGSEQVQLTDRPGDEIEPSYSPGGNVVAYAGNETGNWEIYVFEVRSPNVVQCLTDKQATGFDKRHPTWSPDGNSIAYQCNVNGNWDIFTLPVAGDLPQTQVTFAPTDDTAPAWVPNSSAAGGLSGNAIAYTATVGATTRIHRVDANTLDDEAITDGRGDGLASDRDAAWSKDGAFLAFSSNRLMDGDTQYDYNIYRMNGVGEITTGVEAQPVSNNDVTDTTDDFDPSWSPLPADTQEPMRLYYESERADAAGTEWDIWATVYQDIDPPMVSGLPFTTAGDENAPKARLFTPGSDVYFHVNVFDKDTGVERVFVNIKDPDIKVWDPNYPDGRPWTGTQQWDTSIDGVQFHEWDYQTIVPGIELFDDGDPQHGDAVAGDGMFGGMWTVPANLVSDFVIDVIVFDVTGNWQNYDSLHGFTSEIFSPKANVLFVNDYCEGQHFIYELGFGRNNDFFSGWYVESFYLYNPSHDGSPLSNPPLNTITPTWGDIDLHSIWGYAFRNNVQSDDPDVWRIICRGPVPPGVYTYYLPTVEYQLEPQEAVDDPENAAPSRQVQVANRAVIWAAPHTGDVWVGQASGSIVDAGTQADLGLFLDRGGRVMISGMDIAWALTMNGTISNDFLRRYLKASFVSDSLSAAGTAVMGWDLTGLGGDPVTTQTFGHYPGDEQPDDLSTPEGNPAFDRGAPGGATPTSHDAHDWSWYPDVIRPETGPDIFPIYSYDAGGVAGVRYEDRTTTARAVYLAFGFESIHRGYNTTVGCKNHRSHLIHNVLCWTRTGGFRGQVIAIDDGKPITDPNPVVLIWTGTNPIGSRDRTPDYAVRCQDDGRFRLQGVPSGVYTLEAIRPGYEIDHRDGELTHGGWEPNILNFAISRSRPGVVAGIVSSEATDEPLGRVDVTAYEVPEEEEDTDGTVVTAQISGEEPVWGDLVQAGATSTAVDGSYKIENLPPGDYYVRADGSTIGFGEAWEQITITAGSTTTLDLKLPAADGALSVTVLDVETTDGIGAALVEVQSSLGVVIATGTTNNNGLAELQIQPGTYTVYASGPGYKRSDGDTALVASTQTTELGIALQGEEDGEAVTGKIVSATTGAPVGNVRVDLLVNDVVQQTVFSTDTFTEPGGGQAGYNYQFVDVPAGQVTVRPAPIGFTAVPAERIVTVISAAIVANINFSLDSLHVFPAGLQMISAPYNYTGSDAATVLNVTPALSLKLAAWEASRQRYRTYPQAPADQIRPGMGYWVMLDTASDVTLPGAAAPDPTGIALGAGWNIIGDPFPSLIDWYSATVENAVGVTLSMNEALSEGWIDGGMFAYVLGGYQNTAVFNPWVGTWVKANEALTLYISEQAGTLASPAEAKAAVRTPEDGWLASIRTTVDGMVDTSTYFGAAKGASSAHDAGLDMAKPPVAEFGPYVYAALGSGPQGAHSVDVRSAGDTRSSWRLTVDTSQTGSDVTLQWPDLGLAPTDVKPVLVDLATAKRTYMRTSTGYSFRAGDEPRAFDIIVAADATGALAVTGVTAQQTKPGGSAIAYTLSHDAAVDVEVLNIAGRGIRSVVSGEPQMAGTNSVVWNGLGAHGTRVPSGRYLIRITAKDAEGRAAQVVEPLSLGR